MAESFFVLIEGGGDGGGGDGGPCFLSGTRIAAPQGSVCVENLTVGAMVLTASGESRPVRWLGHRSMDCSRYRDPTEVWPYRVQAGAFTDGMPKSDLWLSKHHALFVDGSLIQVKHLANGATIKQVPRYQVVYWHVELETHDILLAEGLPSESYLDVGNRSAFENGGKFIEAFPNFEPKRNADMCAPFVEEGPVVERARTYLLERAKALGYRLSDDPALHIVADGKRFEPEHLTATRCVFRLPSASSIELHCNSFVPAQVEPGSRDQRVLGVKVTGLEIDNLSIPLDRPEFFRDWYPLELDHDNRQFRWTRERQILPAGVRLVLLELGVPKERYWVQPADQDTDSLAAAS
jgi:hypothetical protein